MSMIRFEYDKILCHGIKVTMARQAPNFFPRRKMRFCAHVLFCQIQWIAFHGPFHGPGAVIGYGKQIVDQMKSYTNPVIHSASEEE